jgi:hypothetical protein
MGKVRIAVILPSRGMSFSRTCSELLDELKPYDHQIFFSIGHTLPDCFNIPIEEALKDETFTHILIVEDDMIIPKGILKSMVNKNYPVVALDYPFQKEGDATTLHDPDGMAIYTGTGFMLIQRFILDAMPKPIFSIKTAWDMMITKEDELICWPRDVSKIKTYGLHDVNFGITMWTNNIPIKVLNRTAGQRKLRQKGKDNTNNGCDEIYELRTVWRDNTVKTENETIIRGFQKRIRKLKTVNVLGEKPDFVYYEDGQARLKGGGDVVV